MYFSCANYSYLSHVFETNGYTDPESFIKVVRHMKTVSWNFLTEPIKKEMKRHAEYCVFRSWIFFHFLRTYTDSDVGEVLTTLSRWGVDIEDFERCHSIISPLRE